MIDGFFNTLKQMSADGSQMSRDMIQRVNAVMYDFTQHYNKDLEPVDSPICTRSSQSKTD